MGPPICLWPSYDSLPFPIMVSPVSNKAKPPFPVATVWNSSVKRFRERALSSGYRNADSIWGETLSHVQEGWLSQPAEFSPNGDIEFFPGGATNAAFRSGYRKGKS